MKKQPEKPKAERATNFIGYVDRCCDGQYVLINALDLGGKPFKIRVYLSKENYNIALHCLYYRIPIEFLGNLYWNNEGTGGYYVIDKATYFKPTQEVDLSEDIDEKLANPKPKKKKGLRLNPHRWKILLEDGIIEIEDEVKRLRDTYSKFKYNDCCQDIHGQNNNGRWLRGQMLSLFYRVEDIKNLFEAYFEDRLAEINAVESEGMAIQYRNDQLKNNKK